MAQEFIDFSDDNVGSQPSYINRVYRSGSGWSIEVEEEAAVVGGKTLFYDQFINGEIEGARITSLDGETGLSNIEIVTQLKVINGGAGAAFQSGFFARASGGDGTEEGYFFHRSGTGSTAISRLLNGARNQLGTFSHSNYSSTSFANFQRFRVNGDQLFAKFWSGTVQDEPQDWDLQVQNADITSEGWIGFFVNQGQGNILAFVGIGTDGDPAPTEPVGVGGETITATADPSLAADHAATLQPTPVTLAATADLTLAQDYAASIGTQPGAIQATADASLSADYAALLQPQPVTLQATPDASGAADYAAQIQPTPVTLTASGDLSLGADYAATITEVDAPVVIEASADLSLGADYAASVVAVPVTISIGFDPSLGADFAAFLSDSSASQTVQARISTGERFTSNTSTSERVA